MCVRMCMCACACGCACVCPVAVVSVETLQVPLVAMEGDMQGSIPIEATESCNKPISLTLLHPHTSQAQERERGLPTSDPLSSKAALRTVPALVLGQGRDPQAWEESSAGLGRVLSGSVRLRPKVGCLPPGLLSPLR